MHDITPNSMNQKRNRPNRHSIGFLGSQFVSIMSIAMVLVVVGIVSFTGVVAKKVTADVRSGFEVVVIVDETASKGAVDTLTAALNSATYISEMKYASAEEVNELWRSRLGDDELAELSPFQAEYDLKVKPTWFSSDSLSVIVSQIKALPAVYDVKAPLDIAANVNRSINTVMLVLTVIAAVLLLITIVLIYNTVSMSIQARRVVIHTMQYVGARPGFIRRPYVGNSVLSGILAGVFASGVLTGILIWVRNVSPSVFEYIGWQTAVVVFLCLAAAGVVVGVVATVVAVNSYLRRSYVDVHRG